MKSSWRWPNNEDFCRNVDPRHKNPVDQVQNYEVMYSYAQGLREFYGDFFAFREANNRLKAALRKARRRNSDSNSVHDLALDVCHYGEMVLLFQRRLALTEAAGGFVN